MDVNLWPAYEFRPHMEWLRNSSSWPRDVTDLHRFNDGQWVKDDGEYDLAFVSVDRGFCLMVEVPYQRNILWSWLTGPWWAGGPAAHPVYRRSISPNPWHYMLRPGEKEWGGEWGRDQHENRRAGEAGMSWVCSQRGAARGRHVEFHLGDPHIAAGLLRRRDTKEVVIFPDPPVCMYCGPWLA